MSDYGSMQARIADEITRDDLTSQIKLAIQSAIKHYERERFWFNETAATSATEAGSSGLALAIPTDAIEFDEITLTYDTQPTRLQRVTWRDFVRMGGTDTSTTNVPSVWTYYRDQFYLYPCPDAAYPLTLYYVEKLSTLVDDVDSNDWMTIGEEMIRGRACAEVMIRYVRDTDAINEQRMFLSRGEAYLSGFEQGAHKSLQTLTAKRRSAGRLRTDLAGVLAPHQFDIRRG